ncbi:MAG: endo-arabinase [Bacteroidetes bacterium]|nr:endo-arabinase [Bacteroidota bacterium]
MNRLTTTITILALFSLSACAEKAAEKKSPELNEADEKNIITLLEKESATWRSGDGKAHADCWEIKPYSRILVSTTDGQSFDVPPAAMKNTDIKAAGGSSSNMNYKISIHGDHAWVNHDEISIDTTGKKSYSHEFRILEKINGNWKLVGQSIHMYKPQATSREP